MTSKVVKVIFVTDEETAGRLEALTELSVKEREASPEVFIFTDVDGRECKLHYVHSETVLWLGHARPIATSSRSGLPTRTLPDGSTGKTSTAGLCCALSGSVACLRKSTV
jgi:hypothetical protein